jgi:hypothetical protein
MRLLGYFIWFWKTSKPYTNYSWPKLLMCGIVPCFKFVRAMDKEHRQMTEALRGLSPEALAALRAGAKGRI